MRLKRGMAIRERGVFARAEYEAQEGHGDSPPTFQAV